jgi:hypothetical protein
MVAHWRAAIRWYVKSAIAIGFLITQFIWARADGMIE